MLNRLTVSSLVQSAIVLMSACLVALLCVSAWNSWGRLTEAKRISAVANASSDLFRAMHNLRRDRSSTGRSLNDDAALQPNVEKYLRDARDAEMPPMRSALEVLGSVAFADQATLVPELTRLVQSTTALEDESWDAMHKPKASRRPALRKEFLEVTAALLDSMDTVSARLAAAVNHHDPVIDQLLMIKQLAWLMRNTAGDASLVISNGLATDHPAPELRQNYTKLVGGVEIAFTALQTAAAGSALPPNLVEAIAETKTANFEPPFLALQDRLLNAILAGEKPEMTASEWSEFSSRHLTSAVVVAERALDVAKDYSQAQRSLAVRSLIMQLALLTCALALTVGTMIAVTRRVIRPLHNMRDAMLKVAAGDLTVNTGYTQRRDEIGALADALETFKQQAVDKLRIEEQERQRNAGAAARQRAIETHVGEFETMVRQTLDQLGDASGQMRTTSADLSAVSSQTNARVQIAERASGEASTSVENVAAASVQLSASIDDISRQASHAAGIANRAVKSARETDDTVKGLAKTASRIGEVVGLINSIAAQTNLLALNATIEAAQAGDAGRGFAVVASEVKSLASQTAKATDDISEQIADIQKVAGDAVDAIKGIGSIIGEVNEVATAISAAVEQQGAATQEITRSTQHAAQSTKNVSDNISGVKTDADAAAAAAENVKHASETLETQSQQLGSQVTQFLTRIRAA